MREPTYDDARLALELYDLRRETELRKARTLIGELSGEPWEKVKPVLDWEHPENAHFRQVIGYWEMAASFVNRGVLHPDTFLDTCSEGIFTFATLLPHLAKLRESYSPRVLVQTETMIGRNPAMKERVELIQKSMAAYAERQKAEAEAKTAAKKPAKSKRLAPARR
jgi:hypothetical protein